MMLSFALRLILAVGCIAALYAFLPEPVAARADKTSASSSSSLNNEAVRLLSNNDNDAAIITLRRVLDSFPSDSDALQLMGVAFLRKGDPVSAASWMERSLAIAGWTSPDVIANYILTLKDAKRLDDAVSATTRALELFPNAPNVINNAALVHLDAGNVAFGLELVEQYIERFPTSFGKYEFVAETSIHYRVFDSAFRALAKGLTVFPGNERLEFLWAVTHQASGDVAKAIELLQEIIKKHPKSSDAIGSLASCYQTVGDLEKAVQYYELILADSQDDAVFLNNYGALLTNFKREKEGERWLLKSVELVPNNVNALVNLGTYYQDNDDMELAKEFFLKAAALNESVAVGSVLNGGHSVLELRARTMLPAVTESWSNMIMERKAVIEGIKQYIATSGEHPTEDTQGLDRTMFYLVYSGYNDRPIQELLTEAYYRNLVHFGLTRSGVEPDIVVGRNNRRVKVGFVSKFFGVYEPHALLLDGVMRYLPRDIYEVIAFPVVRNDGKPLAMSIDKFVDKVIEVPLFNRGAFEVIANEELDILVFADTQSEPINHFLCHNRMATIQIAFWGNPITSGSRNIDYFVSGDDMEHPFRPRIMQGEDAYTEQLVLLEGQGIWYYPPDSEYLKIPEGNIYSTLKSVPISRKDLDIPDDWFVFFCPQSVFKMHPLFDFVFSDILKAIPHAHIIITDGRRESWTDRYFSRLQRSIDPSVFDRFHMIRRISSEKFMNLLKNVDVLLHPFPFDGSRTSADGLAVGLPVLTLPSEYLRGRMAGTFYRTMNIPEMVAKNRSHYIQIAAKLANDRAFYDDVSSKIRERTPLIWEDMDVPFQWVQMFNRLVDVPVPSWEQFIAMTGRNIREETLRRNLRNSNRKAFSEVFGEETWLISGDGAVHLPWLPRDEEIHPIFSDWNMSYGGVSKSGRGESIKVNTNKVKGSSTTSAPVDTCMGEADQLMKAHLPEDALQMLSQLDTRCSDNRKFQERIALLELQASLVTQARQRCLSLERDGPSKLECVYVLGVSSFIMRDHDQSLDYLVAARDLSLSVQSTAISSKDIEVAILKVLIGLNRTNDCLDLAELFLGIEDFEKSGAAILAASFINWNSVTRSLSIIEDRLKMNFGMSVSERSSIINDALKIQRESGQLLRSAFHCATTSELSGDKVSWNNALRGLWKTLREISSPKRQSVTNGGVQLVIPLLRREDESIDDVVSTILHASMTPSISSVIVLTNRSFSLDTSVLDMFTDRLLFGLELPENLDGAESWLHWLWSSEIIRQGSPNDVIIIGK